jgi:RNA polymerase sigma-70 factor (ECF subfamily)
MSPDALVRQHADLVYRVARRVTGNDADAADATQEALVKLWNHLDGVEPASRRAWSARVARNAALDLVRRRQVRPQPLDAGQEDAAPCTGLLPDAEAEAAEIRHSVSAAVQRLAEPYRSIVVLREIEGLSYAEVADALDLPLNTLKVYLHRARLRLRADLRDVFAELSPSS